MKKCKKCNEFLEIESNFYKDKRIKGGYKNICKFCEGSTKINPTNILCKECDQNVEYSKYSIRTKQCKNCYSKLRKTKKSNSNKLRAINIIYNFLTEKTCSDCSLSKKIELFPIRKDSKDGHRNQCIECFGFKQSKGKKDYKQKNKRILRQKDIIYRKERMKNDPLYRAKMDARNIIRKSLSKKGFSKKSRTNEILGCSYFNFKMYIESLFLEGMNWINRNCWHIDHITPLSFAQNEEEVLLINHYTNLQPLWISDNLSKGDSIQIKNETYYKILSLRQTNI